MPLNLNPYLTQAKLWWTGAKLWVYAIALIVLCIFCWYQGKQSCQKAATRALEKELVKQEERSEKAIKIAAQEATRIVYVKEKNNAIQEQVAALPVNPVCVPSDDELRLLGEIQEATAD